METRLPPISTFQAHSGMTFSPTYYSQPFNATKFSSGSGQHYFPLKCIGKNNTVYKNSIQYYIRNETCISHLPSKGNQNYS
eukprot:12682887-Ditylum_brightwellii.AAC.2